MAERFGRDDIAIGIALPFGPGRSNFKLNYTTIDQAKTDLISLLLTHKGERYMQPDFGTNLRRHVFSPNTEKLAAAVKNELIKDIRKWLPFLDIQEIDVKRNVTNIDTYTIDVSITFQLIGDRDSFTNVTFVFNPTGGVAVQGI